MPSLFAFDAISLKGKRTPKYAQVSGEDDEAGRPSTSRAHYDGEEDQEPLFTNERELSKRYRPKRTTRRYIWGIISKFVVGALIAIGIWSVVKWFLLPAVDEFGLPFDEADFGDSLQCHSTPNVWEAHTQSIARVKPGSRGEHAFDARGDAIGTITITSAEKGATELEYSIVLRVEDKAMLDKIHITYPSPEEALDEISRMRLTTARNPSLTSCIRYDVTIAVPEHMNKLHVASHTATHVRFDPDAELELKQLFVTLYSMDTRNLIVAHERFTATKKMALEVYRGKIVGDVSIIDQTTVKTQRGDGVVDVRAIPSPPKDTRNPEPAIFETTTGFGRTNVVYVDDEQGVHRPIRARHVSSRKGPITVSYEKAAFSGLVELVASNDEVLGEQVHPYPAGSKDGTADWTHYVGSLSGKDEIHVNSRGQATLRF